MRVYLTGFMGAGKTSVGRALAQTLGVPFHDLDALIEAREGLPIRTIFERYGEAHFRDLEHRALLATEAFDDAVIATGGGTWVSERNRPHFRRLGRTVWIDPGFDLLLERVRGAEAEQRPLFQNPAQARQLYESRLGAYRQADLRTDVRQGETVEDVAVKIAAQLRGLH